MLKISTRGRYGVRLMLDLALHYNEGSILLKDTAKRQDISEKYLGHIIPPLKAASLINSSRGAHGGYQLTKKPANINLAEVFRAVEGNNCITECIHTPSICDRADYCVMRDVWGEVYDAIIAVLESTTLKDIALRQKKKLKSYTNMYNI